MIVIKPIDVTDTILTSTVAEPDVSKGEVVWTDDLNSAKYTPSTVDSYGLASDGVEDYSLIFNAGWYIENYTSGSLTSTSSILTVVNSLQDLTFFSGGVFATDATSVRRWDAVGDTDKIVNISGGTEAGTSFSSLTESGGKFYLYDKTHTKVRVYDYDGDQTLTHDGTDYLIDLGDFPKLTTTDDNGFVALIGNISYFYSNQFTLLSSTLMDFSVSSDVRINGIARDSASYNIINRSQSLVKNYDLNLIFNGLYRVGDQAIKTETHKIYQAAANTDDDPEVGVNLTVPTWIEVAPTNKYATFDYVINTKSTLPMPGAEYNFAPLEPITNIGLFGMENITRVIVEVREDNGVGTIIYNSFKDTAIASPMEDTIVNDDFLSDKVLFDDLPVYATPYITVTFLSNSSEILIGDIAIGNSRSLGVVLYQSSTSRTSYDTVTFDTFGNQTVISRPSAEYTSFEVKLAPVYADYVEAILNESLNQARIWVGDKAGSEKLFTFGYYERSPIIYSSPDQYKTTLKVRGLV